MCLCLWNIIFSTVALKTKYLLICCFFILNIWLLSFICIYFGQQTMENTCIFLCSVPLLRLFLDLTSVSKILLIVADGQAKDTQKKCLRMYCKKYWAHKRGQKNNNYDWNPKIYTQEHTRGHLYIRTTTDDLRVFFPQILFLWRIVAIILSFS